MRLTPIPRWFWLAVVVGALFVPGCKRSQPPEGTQAPLYSALRTLPPARVDTVTTFDTLKTKGGVDTGQISLTFWSDSVIAERRVIASHRTVVDSVKSRALPSVIPGESFGLFATWKGNVFQPYADWATMGYGSDNADSLTARIAYVQQTGRRMVVIPTGGARANYMDTVTVNGVLTKQFSWSKWTAKLKTFAKLDTAAIGAAFDAGTIEAVSVMDEPFNKGVGGNAGNGWNWPAGTDINKAVDSLCRMTKRVFPARIPVGVFQHWSYPAHYLSCDFITSQYGDRKGTILAERDSALATCKREHIACSFAINVLDGGTQVKRKPGQTDYLPGDCPLTSTGGKGTFFPNCAMTADQIRASGITLGKAGCFLTGFRYDKDFVSKPANQRAFRDIATALKSAPLLSCKRG